MKRLIPLLLIGSTQAAELANFPNNAYTIEPKELRIETAIDTTHAMNYMLRYGALENVELRLITNKTIDAKYHFNDTTNNTFIPATAIECGVNYNASNPYCTFNIDYFFDDGYNIEINGGVSNGTQYQTSWAITKKIDDIGYFINGYDNLGVDVTGVGWEWKPCNSFSLYNNNSVQLSGNLPITIMIGFSFKVL